MSHTVLIVDDDSLMRELITLALNREEYVCYTAANAISALEEFQRRPFDIIISDIKMPGPSGRDGVWLLKRIRELNSDVSVVMLTAVGETEVAIHCLTSGADSYLIKPVNLEELMIVLRKVLDKQRLSKENKLYQHTLEKKIAEKTEQLRLALEELQVSYQATLEALVAALDAREHETGNHSLRVAEYTVLLARKIGISECEIKEISKGALLHDIGKIGISDTILLKPGKLTVEERLKMQEHPEIGADMLRRIGFSEIATDIVYSHQEKYDGSGYPRRLKGECIPLGARIFAVADTFDCMTSDRVYRKASSYDAARSEILECSGTQFDPRVVQAFLEIPEEEWAQVRRESQSRNGISINNCEQLPKTRRTN